MCIFYNLIGKRGFCFLVDKLMNLLKFCKIKGNWFLGFLILVYYFSIVDRDLD